MTSTYGKCGSRRLQRISSRLALVAALVAWGAGAAAQVVVIDPTSDTTPPQLVSFSYAPTAVDTTSGAALVTVAARISDDLAGMAAGFFRFAALGTTQPENTPLAYCNFERFLEVYATNVEGTPIDALAEYTCPFSPYVREGEWRVDYAYLVDRVGNVRRLDTPEALAPFAIPHLWVTSLPAQIPELLEISLGQPAIDTSAAAAEVSATVRVRAPAGFTGAWVTLDSPLFASADPADAGEPMTRERRSAWFRPEALVGGTPEAGYVYAGTFGFPRYSVAGTWTFSVASVHDAQGASTYYIAQPSQPGLPQRCTTSGCTIVAGPSTSPSTLEVTSTPEDRTPPHLTAFAFSARTIDVSLGDASLGFTYAAVDDLSGFRQGCVTLQSPSDQRRGQCFFQGQTGGWIPFPRWSEAGDWNVLDLFVEDFNGHVRRYDAASLAARGFPSSVQVTVGLEVFQAAGAPGGAVDLAARLTSGGAPAAGRTVAFALLGTPVGSAVTDADGVALVSAVSLEGVEAGTYANAVVASFAGDAEIAAVSGSANLTVAAQKLAQTITFLPLADRTLAQATFTVAATASSGLAVQLSAAGACTVAGDVVTLTGLGACSVTASQPGDAEFAPAPSVTRSFDVLPAEHALSIVWAGAGSGTVTAVANGTAVALTCTAAGCTGSVPVGASVVLTEAPAADAVFEGWGIVCTGTASTCGFTMNAAKTVQARFAPASYALAVTIAGGGVGTVTSDPQPGIACGAGATACSASFANGSGVTLTAAWDPAATVFKGWSIAACGVAAACGVTMSGPKTVTARFEPATYPLAVALAGGGSGSVGGGGIACSTGGTGPCSVAQANGDTVVLTAAPLGSSVFRSWWGCTSASGTTCSVSMSAARKVTATFEPAFYLLTVARAGTGGGAVTGTADGVAFTWDACGATECTRSVANGAAVVLTEAPDTGSVFGGWGIVCTGTGTTCSFRMNAAKTVKATFAPATYPLTVALAGGGAGTVSSAPGGIACGPASGSCAAPFANGASVVLTASFDPAHVVLKGWSSSACDDASTSCTVAMTGPRSVTATLEPRTYPLEVAIGGAGSGSVTGPGIACASGGTVGCAAEEPNGARVTLTATPADASSVLAGWSGCSSVSGATCEVAMTAAQRVAATFEPATYPLRVDVRGAGAVEGVAWTSCDPTGCSGTVANGDTVALTASPAPGSTFAGWAVVCTGTGTCTFTMNAAKRVVATFSAP